MNEDSFEPRSKSQLSGKWRPYPAYKDSGVEWLGEIPAHWEMKRIKNGYEVRLGKMLQPEPSSSLDTLEPYLRAANVFWEGVDTTDIKEMWVSPYEKKLYELAPGDLVVCEGGDVGRSALWNGDLLNCYIQNAVHRVRSKPDYSNKILYYWMITLKNAGYIDLLCSKATIAHLTAIKLNDLPVIFPPPDEQPSITNFLEQETAKIDTLVAKKERQIELLQEKRTALISQAVTRGLDPNVPLKDSGIDWLGPIPAHWEVLRLKFLISFVTSGSRGWAQYYSDEGAKFLRIGNLSRVSLDLNLNDVQFVDPPVGSEVERTRVKKDDVLISITAYIGSIAVIKEDIGETYVNQHIALTRPLPGRIEPKWLGYALLSEIGQHHFRIQLYGGTKDGLGLDDVKDLCILLPPASEQKTIVSFLDQETTKIDTLITKIQEGIEKLKEYRTALISAAMTGKIDVRQEASHHGAKIAKEDR